MQKIFPGLILLLIISCKKETSPSTNNTLNPARIRVNLSRAKSFRIVQNQNEYNEYVTASASDGVSSTLDMGTVKYGDSVLAKLPQTFYTTGYQNPNKNTGWSGFVDGEKIWSVTGYPALSIPPFTDTTSTVYSSVYNSRLTYNSTVNKNNPYTVTWDTSIQADSVGIWITSGSVEVVSGFVPGNAGSYTFSPAQLQGLQPNSYSSVQLSGFKQKVKRISDVEFSVRNISHVITYVQIQ